MTDIWTAKRPTLDEDVVPGEALCGCDGVPCRINAVEEDEQMVCGSCEAPCHSVETA